MDWNVVWETAAGVVLGGIVLGILYGILGVIANHRRW